MRKPNGRERKIITLCQGKSAHTSQELAEYCSLVMMQIVSWKTVERILDAYGIAYTKSPYCDNYELLSKPAKERMLTVSWSKELTL